LVAPESELGVHQRWYATTAMDVVLGTDDAVAAKDRLYRARRTSGRRYYSRPGFVALIAGLIVRALVRLSTKAFRFSPAATGMPSGAVLVHKGI
jgi:hypothetical protein